ncbi:MAG: hypothetical protein ACXW2G_03580 [Burkholderiaceae bacterium]
MSLQREVVIEHNDSTRAVAESPGTRVSWSGIFGGVVVGIGVLLLLTALGLAVGITAVDPNNPDAGTIGTRALIWTGVSLLLALFIGGWSAARMSMLWDRTAAMFQGTLVWALFMVLILYLAASGIGLVAGKTFSLVGDVAKTAAGATTGASLPDVTQGNVEQVLARLDDPKTASGIATATGMDQQEVARTLSDLRGRVDAARDDPAKVAAELRTATAGFAERAKGRVQEAAAEAQPAATRTAWATFAALLLGLLAGMAGAAVGRRNAASRTSDLRDEPRSATVR